MTSAAILALLLQPSPLQATVDAYREENHIAGVSVAVWEGDRLVGSAVSGWQDEATGKRMTKNTLVRLASISKSVTGTGAMLLAQQGKLDLDAPVVRYVPEWPSARPMPTLRQLLSHTGGFRHYSGATNPNGGDYFRTAKEALPGVMNGDPVGKPGELYSYSTHSFTVIARAMETASGEAFMPWMHANITRSAGPGGLQCETPLPNENRSQVYQVSGEKFVVSSPRENTSWKHGGGGFEATAEGLARWADAVYDGRIVNKRYRDLMWSKAKLGNGTEVNYGQGWSIGDGWVGHSGSQQGSRTFMRIDRESGRIVVVLCNTSGSYNVAALATTLAEMEF